MQISKPKKTKTTYSQILQPYRYAKSRKEYCCAPLLYSYNLYNKPDLLYLQSSQNL
jgi:hypothetical protein